MSKPRSTSTLCIYLHGHEQAPLDAATTATSLNLGPRAEIVTPAGPVEIGTRFAWYETNDLGAIESSIRPTAVWLASEVDALASDFGVSPDQVILGGYSQGAAMAVAVLEHLKKPIGTLICHHGFWPEGRDYEPAPRVPGAPAKATRALVLSGRTDDVVPPFMGEGLAAALTARGTDVTYEEVASDHRLSSQTINRTADWIGADR